MSEQQDQSRRVLWLLVAVVVALIAIAFIPECNIFGVSLKRANIFADIYDFVDSEPIDQGVDSVVDSESDVGEVADTTAKDSVVNKQVESKKMVDDTVVLEYVADAAQQGVTAIEDYSPDRDGLKDFFYNIDHGNDFGRMVRIGFFGDSFIEADIFTSDVREGLQSSFGGSGVGYVPLSSNVIFLRKSVKHSFSGVKPATWIGSKESRAVLRGKYPLFGCYFTCEDGAEVKYSAIASNKHLSSYDVVNLLFTTSDTTSISVSINDQPFNNYVFEPAASLQKLTTRGNITSIKYRFNQTAGLKCYGAYLDGERGVALDNYALRGETGLNLKNSGQGLNKQINSVVPCDLIVLQYGLNVVWEDIVNYDYYYKGMQGVINHIRESYHDIPILIMGVSDRSSRHEGRFITMAGVKVLHNLQRRLARRNGCLFWSTYSAMGGESSMSNFVEKGWAAKDYTHITSGGGAYLATKFVDALVYEKRRYVEIM